MFANYYYDVILPVIPKGIYTYSFSLEIQPGMRVKVSFGSRIEYGIVLRENISIDPQIRYKPVISVLDDYPVFSENYLKMILKMSRYYLNHEGITLKGIVARSLLASEKKDVESEIYNCSEYLKLTKIQDSIYKSITGIIDKGFSTNLLHGITGSGKTEIYIELIKECLKRDKQAFYIVPEISLTPQIVERLSKRLGFSVPVYHSRLTPKQKEKVFWGVNSGVFPLVIGARSTLFIPSKDIGLIIVDEEHESSFKQEEAPSYHLRDMAVMYGDILGIPVVLGSATPSLESYFNAVNGKYNYFYLNKRFNDKDLPHIDLLDMKNTDVLDNLLSTHLYDKIYEKINKGEQVLLLLNKKGYAKHLICKTCGKNLDCLNCSISLTYYKSSDVAKCSYCGERYRFFKCGECGGTDFLDFGHGTEKATEILEKLFGDVIVRLDTDAVTSHKKLSRILDDFYSGKYKIMVGTQLIAKGFNFPNVTLVGVINIDNLLALPDFRANERAYQLLNQVAGRAGRFIKEGEVLIQTYDPDMPVFQLLNKNSEEFYRFELNRRSELKYPPFSRILRITVSDTVDKKAKDMIDLIYDNLVKLNKDTDILGPSPASVFKIKNRYRYSLILKSNEVKHIQRSGHLANDIYTKYKKGNTRMKLDVDPYFFM